MERAPKPKPRSTKRSGFKETPKGALYLEFSNARVYALRPDPARCFTADLGTAPRWYSLKEPPLEPGSRIRELRILDGTPTPDVIAVKDKEAIHAAQSFTPYFVRRRDNIRKLLAHIPVDIQDILARIGSGSWGLYRFMHRTPAALELCATDDGLRVAFLLAHAHRLLDEGSPAQRRSLALARSLLPKKRKDIVGRFGLPPTKATLHALARIPCAHLSGSLLLDVRQVLADDTRRMRAAHLPVWSAAALKLLCSPWLDRVAPSLLHEVAGDDDIVDPECFARLLQHTATFAQELQAPLPLVHSVGQLYATHQAFMVKARLQLKVANVTLPVAPDVRTPDEMEWVEPLTSLQAMLQEGAAMHHCLGTLADQRTRAEQGRFLAFALHWPCRLTFAIACDDRGVWHVYDLKGFANSVAPVEAWAWAHEFVARWNRLRRPGPPKPSPSKHQLHLFDALFDDGAPF